MTEEEINAKLRPLAKAVARLELQDERQRRDAIGRGGRFEHPIFIAEAEVEQRAEQYLK